MKRKGLTLVELLVVIVIISLLLAILIPTLRAAKERAESLLCSSNIRQLTMAMNMYEMDNGSYPHALVVTLKTPPGGHLSSFLLDRVGWWWLNYIEDYLKNLKEPVNVFRCPLKKTSNLNLNRNILCGNYGVNLSICKYEKGNRNMPEFIGKPLSISSIKRPSKTFLLVDSGYATISYWKAMESPPIKREESIEGCSYVPGLKINKNKVIWDGLEKDAREGRHYNKKVNAGFPDGHIEKMSAKKLLVEEQEPTYKNSPLWVP